MQNKKDYMIGLAIGLIIGLVIGLNLGKLDTLKEKGLPGETAGKIEGVAKKELVQVKTDETLFSFEGSAEGWEIPDWAYDKADYVGMDVFISKDYAKDEETSLKLMAEFPGGIWTGAIVEVMEDFNWAKYSEVFAHVYLPEGAPADLKARLVITIGDDWKFVEMNHDAPLVAGKWNRVHASILQDSPDWDMTTFDEMARSNVRKLAVRVESNKEPLYNGPIYIDAVGVAY
ncbi:MAG: hypothetical protein HQ593_01795 [Candidatus Omnitrophica bacterium]|nr:hypothetical protein [Candidatus Omnitrophota bacterium]